ncbi:uncharacterized protein LOC143919823 isoform X2 [Arctopsyche grandis]
MESVVSEIFKKIDITANRISTKSVMELVAPFIQHDSLEYDSLQRIVDVVAIDGEISEAEMKLAFVKWAKDLKSDKNSCPVKDSISKFQLDFTNIDQNGSSSHSISSTSQGFFQEQRIEDLQNKLAHKEHLILNLKSEIQNLAQQILLHEETYNAIIAEKHQIIEKHNKDQSNCISYDAYNDLKDAYDILNDSKVQLENKIDVLKTENTSLFKKLSYLDEEKQKILQMLSSSEKDKKKARKSLCEAESYIEELKTECINLSDKISEQEILIKSLTVAKESLELELNNMMSKTSNDVSIFRTSEYNSSFYETSNFNRNFDHTFNESSNVEIVPVNHYTTSTPRNNVSLMQELTGTSSLFVNSNNYNCTGKCLSNNNNFDIWSTSNGNNSSNCKFKDETTIEDRSLTISLLENELDAHKTFNVNLSKNFKRKIEEISSLKSEIDNLNKIITNMKQCLSVSNVYCHCLNNTMKETQIKTRILLYLIKENCVWVGKQHGCLSKILSRKDSTSLDFKGNNLNEYDTVLESMISNKKYKAYSCGRFIYKIFFWLLLICFILLCLHLYNTLMYFNIAKRGTKIYFLPWNWVTVNEFVSTLFSFQYQGPVPT